MADIRINALATTATTPASDDYLALDGTAQGTRKILATNIANNVTDVILGTSGPSVKSTLSARAPRQGLVFDGSQSAATRAVLPDFGTQDFSAFAWIRPTSLGAAIFGPSTGSDMFLLANANGSVQVANGSVSQNISTSAGVLSAGKNYLVGYTRTGGVGTIWVNGISITSDADTYSWGKIYEFGASSGGASNKLSGIISQPLVYNRALSASEVVALYEAGAPAGADYGPSGYPAGTAVANNGSFGTDGTVSPSVNTGPALTWSDSDGGYAYSQGTAGPSFKGGKKAYVTFTASGVSGTITAGLYRTGEGTPQSIITVANGANVIPVATGGASVGLTISFNWSSASAATLTNISWVAVGLLLAPDAAQAGGGLTWYDTSGNAANITLPASGVSWNVPSSRVLGGNWSATGTFGIGTTSTLGTLNVATPNLTYGTVYLNGATTTADFMRLKSTGADGVFGIESSGGGTILTGSTANSTVLYSVGATALHLGTSGTTRATLTSGGNYLIGTTTDSANGRLQLATHTTSAGGIGFGTDTSLFRAASGNLCLNDSGTNAALSFYNAGTLRGYVFAQGSTTKFILGSLTAGWSTEIQSGNGTTALTLDSSQNATFAGGTVTLGDYAGDQDVIIAAQSTGVGYLRWRPTASGTNAYGFSIAYDNPNNKLSFLRHEFSTAGTEWLSVARSTGDATFAGNVTVSAGKYLRTPDVRDGTSTNDRLVHTSSTTAIFAGGSTWTNAVLYAGGAQRLGVSATACSLDVPLKLNNAYQAGAPTATGYVTIQDSAGNTYKVLVGT